MSNIFKKVTKTVKKALGSTVGKVLFPTLSVANSDAGLKTGAGIAAGLGLSSLVGNSSATGSGSADSSGFLGNVLGGLTGSGSSGSFLGGLINTGLGLLGSYGSSVFNAEQQEKLNDRKFKQDVEMWNMQNAYNSPLAQMQRYQEAGLNPNLIYGNGTSSAGNASGYPQYEAPTFKGIDLNSIMMFQQLENLNSQNRLLEAQTQQAIAQAKNIDVDNKTKIVNASNAQDLVNADLSIKRAMARETNARASQVERGSNLSWYNWIRDKIAKFPKPSLEYDNKIHLF